MRSVRFVGKGFADRENLIQVVEQHVDRPGFEMQAALLFHQVDDFRQGPGRSIAALASKGIEDVGHGGEPSIDMNILAALAVRIAAAVPLFVMVPGDDGSGLKDAPFRRFQHILSQLRVGFHDLPFPR